MVGRLVNHPRVVCVLFHLVLRSASLGLQSKVGSRTLRSSTNLSGGVWQLSTSIGLPSSAVSDFYGLPHGLTAIRSPHRAALSFCSPAIPAAAKSELPACALNASTTKLKLPPSDGGSVSTTTSSAANRTGDDVAVDWDCLPITRLRTVCRKLQLPCKGKRDDIVERLKEAPVHEVLALLDASSEPPKAPQTTGDRTRKPEALSELASKPKSNKCHVCNGRLSARARFCSKCGATISAVGQETLRDFVEKAFWPVREQEVGGNTMRVERGFWQSILEVIGDVPVANLSAGVWEEYIRALKKRNCSPRTQALHQVAYLAALKYAVHTRRLDSVHPFRKIRGCTKRTLVSVPLTAEEVYLLLAATPNTMHCALFAVGIGAGLRPSEILSMRWEDVNMEEMTATIRGSKTAASAAAIPLTNLAARELMRWWEEEGRPRSGLCFYAEGIRTASVRANLEKKTPMRTNNQSLYRKPLLYRKDPTHPTAYSRVNWHSRRVDFFNPMHHLTQIIGSFKKALQAAAQRAGIDETRCGERRRIFPYILRHSFATIAATSNPPVPLPVAQAVMRHTSSKMLLETYAKAGALVIKEGLRNFKI